MKIKVPYLSQMGKKSYALDSLPEAHLVSQYPVDALVIEVGQPVHALQLVGLELALEDGRLGDVLIRGQHRSSKTEVSVNCGCMHVQIHVHVQVLYSVIRRCRGKDESMHVVS